MPSLNRNDFGNEYGSLGASGLAGLATSGGIAINYAASPSQSQSYSASNVLQQTHYNQGLQQSHPSSGDLMNPLPSKR